MYTYYDQSIKTLIVVLSIKCKIPNIQIQVYTVQKVIALQKYNNVWF